MPSIGRDFVAEHQVNPPAFNIRVPLDMQQRLAIASMLIHVSAYRRAQHAAGNEHRRPSATNRLARKHMTTTARRRQPPPYHGDDKRIGRATTKRETAYDIEGGRANH